MPKYHTWRNECIDFRIPFVNVPIQSTHKSVCLKCMHSHVNISPGALEVIIFYFEKSGKIALCVMYILMKWVNLVITNYDKHESVSHSEARSNK